MHTAYLLVLVTEPLTPPWGQMQALLMRRSFYSLQHCRHLQDVTFSTFLRIAPTLTNTCTSVVMTISTAPPEQRFVLCNEDYSSASDPSKTNSENPPIQYNSHFNNDCRKLYFLWVALSSKEWKW